MVTLHYKIGGKDDGKKITLIILLDVYLHFFSPSSSFPPLRSGILLRTVAEAMADHTPVSKFQLVLDGVGFCLTVVATIIIGFYAKRKLEQLHEQEEQQQLI